MSTSAVTPVQVDVRLAAALRLLVKDGLPDPPAYLPLRDVAWGGEPCPSIDHVDVEDSGKLTLKASFSTVPSMVEEPANWRPDAFTAVTGRDAQLVIDHGVTFETGNTDEGTVHARFEGWTWRVVDPDDVDIRLWAARLRFGHARAPVVLWWRRGNLRVAGARRRAWRFGTPQGQVFLLPSEDADRWVIAFEALDGASLDQRHVNRVLAAIGYALGEPLQVTVFRAVCETSLGGSLDHATRPALACRSAQAPALPLQAGPTRFAQLVELVLQHLHAVPDSALLVALHMYFASVDGYLESKFLHAWIAAESLAGWAIRERKLQYGGPAPLVDKPTWHAWVNSRESEIRAQALPGMDQQLVDRVRRLERDTPSTVERVFLGEGLGWTAEHQDVYKARNQVAHEGSLIGRGTRNWDRDRERIGLAQTLLTALIARLVGYDGPISDRSKTIFSVSDHAEPAWWTPGADNPVLDYEA